VFRRVSIWLSGDDNVIARFKASERDTGASQMVHVLPYGAVGGITAFDCQGGVGIGPVNPFNCSLDGDNLILPIVSASVVCL
jgi:hypothetical protein